MPESALSPVAEWIDSPTAPSSETKPAATGEPLGGDRLFIAVSPAMREVRRQIGQLAAIDAAVLLFGESGTGKGTAARMIHNLSHRSPHRFVKVNCAALSAELLESDLFGHEPGAFSGARQARAGKLEVAHKGTLLLEDMGWMPLAAQAMLLRFLQDKEFSRLGGTSAMQADVRVLAAADGDLRQAMRNGALRPDLYYRLNVIAIHLPPLRDRREDLPHLLNHFMAVWAQAYGRPRLPVTRRILDVCASYAWPGNLRELENFVKRYLVMGDEQLALDQLEAFAEPQASGSPQPAARTDAADGVCDLKSVVRGLKRDAERAAIVSALERTGGNKQEAAGLLHISLRALHYKVQAYQIESKHGRAQMTKGSEGTVTLPRAVGDSGPYERSRGSGGKLISMNRPPIAVR